MKLNLIIFLQFVIIVSSKVKSDFPQVYEDVDETNTQIIPNTSKSDQRFSIINQPQIDLQKLRYAQQQNIDTQNRIKARQQLRKRKNPKVPKKREIRNHNFNEVPFYLLHPTYPVLEDNKFVTHNGGKDEIQALNALIGKNPDAQLEGLKFLLKNNNHKPITEDIVDVSNPQRQPNVKVEQLQEQHYQTLAPHTGEHNYLTLVQIEKQINDEAQLKAQEALVQAQEHALKVVEAQHQVLAIAQAQAQKEAFENVHRYETVKPVLVEQSVVDKTKDGVSIKNLDKIAIKSRLKREVVLGVGDGGKEINRRSKRDNPTFDYYDDSFEGVHDDKQSEYGDSNSNPVNVNDRIDNNSQKFLSSQLLNKLKQDASVENENMYLSDRIVPKRSNEYVNGILAYFDQTPLKQNEPSVPNRNYNIPDYPSQSPDLGGIISLINPNKNGLVIIKPKPKIKSLLPYLNVNNENYQQNVQDFEEPKLPVKNLEDILEIIGQKRPSGEASNSYNPQQYLNVYGQNYQTSTPPNVRSHIYQGPYQNSNDLILINQISKPKPQEQNVEELFSLIDQIQQPTDYTTIKSVSANPKLKNIQDILNAFDQKPKQVFNNPPPVSHMEAPSPVENMLLSLGLTRLKKDAQSQNSNLINPDEDFIVEEPLPNASQQSFNIIDNILSYVDQNSPGTGTDKVESVPQVGISESIIPYVRPALGSLANASQSGVDLFKTIINYHPKTPQPPKPTVDSKPQFQDIEQTQIRPITINLPTVSQENFNNIDEILNKYNSNTGSLNLQNVNKPDHGGHGPVYNYNASLMNRVEPTQAASLINNVFSNASNLQSKPNFVEKAKSLVQPTKQLDTSIKLTSNTVNDMQRLRDIYNTIAFMNENEQSSKNPTFENEVDSQIRNSRNVSSHFEKLTYNASKATVKNIEGSLSFLGQIKVAHGDEKDHSKGLRPPNTVKLKIENSGDILAFLEPHESQEDMATEATVYVTPEVMSNFELNQNEQIAPQAPMIVKNDGAIKASLFTGTIKTPEHQDQIQNSQEIQNVLASLENEMKLQPEPLANPVFMPYEEKPQGPQPVRMENVLSLVQQIQQKQPDNTKNVSFSPDSRSSLDRVVKFVQRLIRYQPKRPIATAIEKPIEQNMNINEFVSLVNEMKHDQNKEPSVEEFMSMLEHHVSKNEVTTVAPDKSKVIENMEQIISYLEQIKAQNTKTVNQVVLNSENQNKIDAKNMNEIITLLSQKNSPTVQDSPKLNQELINRVLELLSKTNLNLQNEEPKSKVEKIKQMLNLMDQNKLQQEESNSWISRLTIGEQLDLIMKNMNITRPKTINEPKLIIDDVKDYLSLVDQNEKMRNLLDVLPTQPNANSNEPNVNELLGFLNKKSLKDNLVEKSDSSDESQYYNYLTRIQRSPDLPANFFSHLDQNRANLQTHQLFDVAPQNNFNARYPNPSVDLLKQYASQINPLPSAPNAHNWREPPVRTINNKVPPVKVNRFDPYPGIVFEDYPPTLLSPNVQDDFLTLAQPIPHHHKPPPLHHHTLHNPHAQTQNFADFLTLLKRVKDNSHPRTYNDMLTLLAQGKQGLHHDYFEDEEIKEDPSQTNQTIRDVMPLLEKNKPVNLIVINNSNDNHKNNQHKNYPRPRIPPPNKQFYHSRRNFEPRIPSWVLASRRRSDYNPDNTNRPSYVQRY